MTIAERVKTLREISERMMQSDWDEHFAMEVSRAANDLDRLTSLSGAVVEGWTGTKQRNDLATCPFCDTAAVQQVRLANSATEMQFRIGCGNPFCGVEPNTPPFAALRDAEWAWHSRAASPPPSPEPLGGPLSDATKAAIREIDEARRRGVEAGNMVVGSPPSPELEGEK